MWLAFTIGAVCSGLSFYAGHFFGWRKGHAEIHPALDDLRKLSQTRMDEIQELETGLAFSRDLLSDLQTDYDILEKRLKSAEEFRDGVLELARRLPVSDERMPTLHEIMWNVSQQETPKTTRVGADEPLGVVTKNSDT